MKIAHYTRRSAAQKYADDLAKSWSGGSFEVVCHPFTFGFTVAALDPCGAILAYVAKRNRRLDII
jgi:hypothetical protein